MQSYRLIQGPTSAAGGVQLEIMVPLAVVSQVALLTVVSVLAGHPVLQTLSQLSLSLSE